MQNNILGWDVGGAHLKAALLNPQGQIQQVIQVACPLWKGLDQLSLAIRSILNNIPESVACHAVTMTGEMVDLFPNRLEGVCQIADVICQELSGNVWFYTSEAKFVAIADVAYQAKLIASANWHASAFWIASQLNNALLVDIGSTTTDLITLSKGQVCTIGINDAERMQNHELVYTGVVRTPLMAIAQKIAFAGQEVLVAAEYFANTGDIYRITGDIELDEDMADTADGADKSIASSMRRLARMVGCDINDAPESAWHLLALAFKHAQLNQITTPILKVTSRNLLSHDAPIVGAGAGRFLAKQLALILQRPYFEAIDFFDYDPNSGIQHWVNVCLPACAVASLLKSSE